MNYADSVKYLLDLGNEVSAMKLGLENITKVLNALGAPQHNYLKIQVAGTNGKGSTCQFLDAICVSANIKTGLFTSPHLVSITERIKIGGAEISPDDFARYATGVRLISENLVAAGALETVPTYFEQVTAIALAAFAERKIELAILETGLGGRFDAVTAARAEIVVITPIDYDHQNILGDSLAEIAAEKAAIIRAETRVVLAPQKKDAEKVIAEKCFEERVEPIRATESVQIEKRGGKSGDSFLTMSFTTANGNYPNLRLGLNGRHQAVNAATAIAVAETLGDYGLQITQKDICAGLENAEHRGRLEFRANILFDGAHNVAGAKALREYLDEFVRQPITLVFGAMRDKETNEIARILFPRAENLIFTKPDNPRSLSATDLLQVMPPESDRKKVYLIESVEDALEKAGELSAENGLILITGSLYLVGEAQKLLNNKSAI